MSNSLSGRWVEFTGMDGGPVLIAVPHVVTVTAAEQKPGARTEIATITAPFYVQEDYAMVRKVLGQYS